VVGEKQHAQAVHGLGRLWHSGLNFIKISGVIGGIYDP